MADYTELTFDDCASLLAPYGWQLDSLQKLAGGAANSSYSALCTPPGPHVVVTILDNHDQRSATSLQRLTDWLIEQRVQTPAVLLPEGVSDIVKLAGKPCFVRPFVVGEQPESLSLSQTHRVGAAMAHFHSLAVPEERFELPTRRLPEAWRAELTTAGAPMELMDVLAKASDEIHIGSDSEKRLLHGDLFPDNLLWGPDGSLHLLDWETASLDWAPLDLGFTLVGLANGHGISKPTRDAFIDGYAEFGMPRPSPTELAVASRYACAVLMFHRYRRHVIRYPDPTRFNYWRGLVPFWQSVV